MYYCCIAVLKQKTQNLCRIPTTGSAAYIGHKRKLHGTNDSFWAAGLQGLTRIQTQVCPLSYVTSCELTWGV